MGLFEDQQARQKRTEEFIKARDMTQGQVVEKLLKAEPELKSKGYSVNLSTYLKENKINPKEIKDTSWMRPVKQTELRNEYASKMKKSTPKARKNSYSFGANTQTIDLPLAAESPVKQNDFLPPSATSEQIFEIPQDNTGRIHLDPAVSEPKTVIKEEKSDNSKYFAIGGIAIAAIVLFLILRRRK